MEEELYTYTPQDLYDRNSTWRPWDLVQRLLKEEGAIVRYTPRGQSIECNLTIEEIEEILAKPVEQPQERRFKNRK